MGMILPEQILNNLTDGITVQDTNFKIIYQNKIMADTFGKQVGEYCYQVYEKRNKICEGCGIQRAFLTGEKNMTIRVAKGINKESSYWENSCFPLFDDRGNIMAGVEVCRDVTDRVTLEEEVKERNIKLSQVNNELIQKSEQLQKSLYERNLIEEKLRYEIETRLDTEKELHASHDNLRKTLEKLKQTQVKMLQSEKMAAIGQLAAGIAHEINNPTGFVSSNLTTLGEYSEDISKIIDHYKSVISLLKDSGKRSKYKDDISLKLNEIEAIELALDINFILIDIENLISESKEGVVRIKNIVDDLKDFAHPGQNKPECSNINRNLDSTLSMICGEIKKNKVKVIKEYGNIPSIVCYPQKLNQVFMNVLVNALQSMRKNGKLTITTSVINSHLKIDISDNGSGIPKKNLQKIFDPFFTTKPVGKGTGLGLNIAYNIIKEHNGNITAHSLQGKGTTFSITLPLN